MPIRTSNSLLGGGALAKWDLLIIGILTAAVSCIGISELLFRSGGAVALLLLSLLVVCGSYGLGQQSKKNAIGSGERGPGDLSLSEGRVTTLRNKASLPNRLTVVFAYIAVLCWAGVVFTGGTMATVVLVVLALLATLGASHTFLRRQASTWIRS